MSETTTNKTLISVYETMDEDQKTVVAYLINKIPRESGDSVEQSGTSSVEEFLKHQGVEAPAGNLGDIYESLNPEQKKLFEYAVGKALEVDAADGD